MKRKTSFAKPATVDVWTWPLDVSADERAALQVWLSVEERARADRFVRSRDKERWIVARGGMRLLLSRATGQAPEAIRFTELKHGRPELAPTGGPTPSFNLSHSEGLAALAVSFDAQVGADVEAHRSMTADEVAYALSPAERFALERLEGAARLEAFFEFWTLKEAFIKALGLGLSQPLHDFDMALSGAEPARLARLAGAPDEPLRWRFTVFEPGAGFSGAIAARTEGRDLTIAWHASCTDPS